MQCLRCRYDSHREQILRAGSHQAGGGSGGFAADQAQPPEDIFLYQWFSSSCYSGFDDGPKACHDFCCVHHARLLVLQCRKCIAYAQTEALCPHAQGFYTVYREVFAKLARAEAEAAERAAARGDKGAPAQALPVFPAAQAPWADVSAFYQAWLHFVSDREFAWADAHNLATAPNRKVLFFASFHEIQR